jgi:hypothetical protein
MKVRRNKRGNIAELGPAFVVFICFIFTPLIDLGFIPVRYLIAQGVINEYVHRLSLAEKRSQSYEILATDNFWRQFLTQCGITLREPTLKLIVCGNNDSDKISVESGEHIASEWLPNGSKGPCLYSMELSVDADINPLYTVNNGLPGLAGPVTMKFASRSNWENFGRDPVTKEYYVNE